MRFVLAMTAAALAIGASAYGADLKYTCARGDTTRSVAVVSDPASGHSCEVQYQKTSMGDAPEVLWHADSGTDFCVQQAQTLAQRLGDAGWTCAQGETAALGADQSPQPYSVPVEVGSSVSTDDPGMAASGVTAAIAPAAAASSTPAASAPNFKLRPPLH